MMQVRVTNLKEVQKFLNKLPKELQTEVRDIGIPKVTKELQKLIKFHYTMAGYGTGILSTGAGLRSIEFKKTDRGSVININSAYLAGIEKGLFDSHWVSMDTIEAHRAHPGSTVGMKAPEGYVFSRPPIWWQYKGPFVEPAMIKFREILPNRLNSMIKKAINNARGKR